MGEEQKTLHEKTTDWLREHPRSTTLQIARGIQADVWDVQHEILYMHLNKLVEQHPSSEMVGERKRPSYSLKEAGDGQG